MNKWMNALEIWWKPIPFIAVVFIVCIASIVNYWWMMNVTNLAGAHLSSLIQTRTLHISPMDITIVRFCTLRKVIKMKIKLTEHCSSCALSMFTVALKGTTLHSFAYDGVYHYLFIELVQWWKWFFNFITIFNNGLLINHGYFLTIPSQPM